MLYDLIMASILIYITCDAQPLLVTDVELCVAQRKTTIKKNQYIF